MKGNSKAAVFALRCNALGRLIGSTALLLTACGGAGDAPAGSNTAGSGVVGAAGNAAMTSTGVGGGGVGGGQGSGAGSGGTSVVVNPGYDIGFAPVTRLNHVQYNNTVADLLGTSLKPADRLPADNLALGFDTIASVLTVSPEHIEGYLNAARDLVAELLARPATDPVRQRFFTCDVATGAVCQLQVLHHFAQLAWRRPVMDSELAAYSALVAAQPTVDEGMALGLRAILTSANFIYRIERDLNPDDVTPHALRGHELAARLSYFLWSTTPDADLSSAADGGTLSDPSVLLAQVDRMLTDPVRSRQMVDNFGTQWLNINRTLTVTPDPTMFPLFDEPLRQAMVEESKLFFAELLSANLPVSQMFTADFKYVNARLAEHYQLPAVSGDELQRVSTAGTNRIGILTQGAFLAGMSNPTRTSPVKRGLTVMDRLLCASPPAPPPGVDTNIDKGSGLENLSVRERLKQHEQKAVTCGACHVVMDAIGLGLENYDAVGTFRTEDSFGAIDASGALPAPGGGAPLTFTGATELSQILATDPRINACVVQHLLTYALGRQIGGGDQPLKDALTTAMEQGGASLRSAINAIVTSDAFRSRRAAATTELPL